MSILSNTFRELFLASMAKTDPTAALFLSGGVDSATNLAAALHLGRRPTCVTFRVDGIESRDVATARAISNSFGLALIESCVPADIGRVIADTRRVLRIIGKAKKTHVQCSHPFLYMGKAMLDFDISKATWGMRAVWGISRDVAIAQAREGDLAAIALRHQHFADPDFSENSIERVLATFGVTVQNPWRAPAFAEFFLNLTMKELHKPFEKAVAVEAFPEFWGRGAWRKPADNLQIGSGLRALHDKLLLSPVNRKGRLAVVAVYRDMLDEENSLFAQKELPI